MPKPFVLHVDASDKGAGAVLLQFWDDVLHPVCYASMKFKPYQKHYSTIEKECYALIFATERFNVYFSGSPFPIEVYTDHNPLLFLQRMRNSNQRLMRWALALQPYNIIENHIRGKKNVIADMLSRTA